MKETGLEKVALLNDFVANGYGASNLKEEEILEVYKREPTEWFDDNVKLVQGIGTGYGGCQLAREPSRIYG